YMLFFTNKGRVYWHKVYGIPELARDRRGRAIVNLLNLSEGEQVTDCRAVRDFDQPDNYLMMATRQGVVKKTDLAAFRRPQKHGIIAINLREGDELVDVVITKPGDEVVLSTARGMAIRFRESDVRAMGRTATGVKGISLAEGDAVVGMVVADPNACLLTACANGFGKRTPFGPNSEPQGAEERPETPLDEAVSEGEPDSPESADEEDDSGEGRSGFCYRTQNRGGKGLRDIKTEPRNGPVIGIVRVAEKDEIMMITARGKIQRVAVSDIRIVGRNTQGVKIMSLEEGDTLVAVKRVPHEENGEERD
ncbi:MAG: DNA gyrase subunit A, partial [Thermoguttaceae bacterium]|nr:DNA gyrase subunit A [Thermoguttaceae bacterium]